MGVGVVNGRLREGLAARLPAPARQVDVNGVNTYVLEIGDGPPLVLLHGGIESAGAYWTAPVVTELAKSHRLIIPDAPGLGESEPVDRLDAAAFADWFGALLRITCPQPAALVAHSLLGTLAAQFAADHSEQLRRLVLWGAPGVGPYRMPRGLIVAAARMSLRPSPRSLSRFARWPFHDLDATRRRDPAWFDAFFAYTVDRARVGHVKRTMGQLIRSCTKQVPEAVLGRIAVPTALLWGPHDRMVPAAVGQWASARLGWPLRWVADTGHVPHLEDPGAFVAVLRDLVTPPGAGERR